MPGLNLRCAFCNGRREVGGDHEPAEDREPQPVDPMNTSPAWEELGWMPTGTGCERCGGSGEVISLGGAVRGGEAKRMLKGPCPSCRPLTA